MIQKTLCEAVSEVGTGSVVYVSNLSIFHSWPTGVVQCDIEGDVTVNLEGRVNQDFEWYVMHTFTESGVQAITFLPELRWNVTSVGESGTNLATLGIATL